MTSQQKAAWLSKANPYKQPYLWDAFREGARAFWTGTLPEYHGNSRERAAFNKDYSAAEAQSTEEAGPGQIVRGYRASDNPHAVEIDAPIDPGYYVPCGQTDPA